MNFIVYKISNTINNKVYYGVTQQSLKKRWQQHICNSSKKDYHLYNAINKYGVENFKIEAVFYATTKDEMYKKEIELISFYKSNNRKYGYNNSKGGEFSRYGCKLTNEQKNKISEFQKNRKRKPHSEETKKRISESAKGRDMRKLFLKSAEKRKGKPAFNRIKISQYTLDGKFVNEYKSLSEAANSVKGHPSAFAAIKKGKLKTYKSFVWKY
jgi:group I intron endonuclease